eukprot:CAMPEP_0177670716 /NCGR_PEP_ID=MMETSP0447-20121125/24251_1 /TAXON_ID=0 /ORGANISM="Stygamoeba regulata, Strain BSH-02190019" /LENGTH=418 /DNA_ID=CAMNT_0019177925 /DNA_START=199 /DNA_END=1455 /DNA_ORIENTATION=+
MAHAVRQFLEDYRLLSVPAELKKSGALFVNQKAKGVDKDVEEGVVVFSVHHLLPGLQYRTASGNLVRCTDTDVVLTRKDGKAHLSFPLPPPPLDPVLELRQLRSSIHEGGFLVHEKGSSKGKIIFHLSDLPVGVPFLTECGCLLTRVSESVAVYNDEEIRIENEKIVGKGGKCLDSVDEPNALLECLRRKAGEKAAQLEAHSHASEDTPPPPLPLAQPTRQGSCPSAEAEAEVEAERVLSEELCTQLAGFKMDEPGEPAGRKDSDSEACTDEGCCRLPIPRPLAAAGSISQITQQIAKNLERVAAEHSKNTFAIGFPVTMKVVGGGRCRVTISLSTKHLRLRRKRQLLASEYHGRYTVVADLHESTQFTLIASTHTYHFVASSAARREDIISTIRFFCSCYPRCSLTHDAVAPAERSP